jgi:small subunit ribosomal protein S20
MPNTDSARRALRKMERRRVRNRVQRSTLRTTVKKIRLLAVSVSSAQTPMESAAEQLRLAIRKIDQAASRHLIHKNKASRDKSRLTKLFNKAQATAAAKTSS